MSDRRALLDLGHRIADGLARYPGWVDFEVAVDRIEHRALGEERMGLVRLRDALAAAGGGRALFREVFAGPGWREIRRGVYAPVKGETKR